VLTIHEAVAAGRLLFFSARRDHQETDLWRSDGAELGTRVIVENALSRGSLRGRILVPVAGILLFAAAGRPESGLKRSSAAWRAEIPHAGGVQR